MGTPYFIVATGQSNIYCNGNGVPYNWNPNPRAKVWNNIRDDDSSIGNAFVATPSNLVDMTMRYASDIADADPNKDVYSAIYARAGGDISLWIGGTFRAPDFGALGSGKIYLNNTSQVAMTAIWVSRYDVYGVARWNTGNGLWVGQYLWLKQGSTIAQYQVGSFSNDAELNYTIYVTHVASNGAFNTSSAIQVEFQPRMLYEIENSVPVALAAAGKTSVDVLMWWQGESDAGFNTRYTSEFNFIMSYLGAKSWWRSDTKILICGLNSTANNGIPASDQMNSTLASLVTGYPNRYFCNTAANLTPSLWADVYHLTAAGFAAAGDLMFNNVYKPPLVAAATYAVAPSTTSLVEGSSVTFSVSTTGVANGTVLYWTNGGTTSSSDFADSANSGSVTINNNAASITRSLVSDSLTEGGETIVLQLRTGSTGGTIVATAATVTVTDPSGGTGGTSTITGMSVSVLTEVMDITPNPAHQVWGGGLWVDGPPHPYRDASGNVYVMLKHSENYRFRIPDWNNSPGWVLQGPTYTSVRDGVEGHYNLRHWVFGVYASGNTLYGLTHHEWYHYLISKYGVYGFNGWNDVAPGSANFNREWVNGIGHVVSTDGGATFTISPNNDSTRLTLVPEPWGIQKARPMYGFFHASNIVKEGNYYYACVEQRSVTQTANEWCTCGMSMIRTSNPAVATGWEFWDGSSWVGVNHGTYQGNLSSQKPYMFFQQTTNFYVLGIDPANGQQSIGGQTNSHMGQNIRFHTPTNQWIIFGFAGTSGYNFGYSTSPTLANPQFNTVVPITNSEPLKYLPYMAVFDANATDQNYQNIGNNLTVLTVSDVVKINKGTLTISVSTTPPPTPTYSIAPSTTSVNEGQSVTFTITTSNVANGTVLYWNNGGSTTAADFTDSVNSGSVTINNNSATLTRTLTNDVTTEGTETLVIQLRTGSSSGTLVATSLSVTVNDTSVPTTPTYSVTPSATAVAEGTTVTFNVTTTNLPGDNILYWTNAGTTSAADFSDGANSGAILIRDNAGWIARTFVSDAATEGNETLIFQLRTGSTAGPIVATATTVTVSDPATALPQLFVRTSPTTWTNTATASGFRIRNSTAWIDKTGNLAGIGVRNQLNNDWIYFVSQSVPTYGIAPSATNVNEGQTVTFSVTTTNFGTGTLYWTTSGTVAAADFSDNALTGSVAITNNVGTITRTLANDVTTEGVENFSISLRTNCVAGTVVAASSAVTVNDTSVPGTVTYSVVPTATTINEGQTVTFNVTTTNLPGDNILYWTNAGTTSAADFSDGANSGGILIRDNAGWIARTLVNDLSSEGGETISWQLRTGSTSGPVVATAATVVVVDTSVPANPTYAIAPTATSINEGQTATFNVTTTNFGNGTLYWTNNGTTNGADFTDGANSGSVAITNNAGTISRTLANDQTSEGGETIALQLRTSSVAGTVVATSATVVVADTSVPTVPTSLTMNRNNLDFIYLPDKTSTQEPTMDMRVTINASAFFAVATNPFDHMPFALDCAGGAGNNDPHCGPIYRNGRNLFVTARGFFITRSGVWSEIWNGTGSPVIAQVANTSGQVFDPTQGTYVVRIRAGYSTGFYANMMTITVTRDTLYGQVVFQGSAGIGATYTGVHRVAIAAIATGFQGPAPANGCIEPSGPGSAYGGDIPISGFSLNLS